MLKKIIVVVLLLSMIGSAYSQDSTNKQPVSVKLDIVGKGAPAYCTREYESDYYFVTVNIQNTQDTALTFFFFTCSWPMDSFIIVSDSIAFVPCFMGCDFNIPTSITLPPKKTVQFNATINCWKKDKSIPRIRIGFKYFRTVDELWYLDSLSYKKIPDKMVWSNEVELKDNLYTYEIK